MIGTRAQCSNGRGGERSPGAVNVAPTEESNAPSCFKSCSTPAAQAVVPSGSIVLIKRHISWSSILYTLYLQGSNVEVGLMVKWINTAEIYSEQFGSAGLKGSRMKAKDLKSNQTKLFLRLNART